MKITLGGNEIGLPETLTLDHLSQVAEILDNGQFGDGMKAAIERGIRIIAALSGRPVEELRAMPSDFREFNAATAAVMKALGLDRVDAPGEAAPAAAGS